MTRRPLLLLLGALLAACAGSEKRIDVVTPTPVDGMAGETVQVEFRLVDADERAYAGETVRFMLDGAPDGTSLREELATTDSRGGVTALVSLMGEGSFDVVATAEDATAGVAMIRVDAIGTAYDLCAADPSMCRSPETCTMVSTSTTMGAICTTGCATAADCPAAPPRGAACVDFAGMGGTCMKVCAIEADCNDSDQCSVFTDLNGTSSEICIPSE